jgi:uncharacterized membrane protein YhhN
MIPLLIAGALTCLAGEFLGVPLLVYIGKPLVTLVLLLIALRGTPPVSARYRALIAAGLCWSLAGDVFLMLPGDQFIAGLASFLVAHLCYAAAFAGHGGGVRDLRAAGVFVVAGVILAVLWPSLGALQVPVTLYVVVITAMTWQALTRFHRSGSADARLAAYGALLFMVSDASLAFRRFRGDFTGSVLLVMGTYWLAQWGIARSVSRQQG